MPMIVIYFFDLISKCLLVIFRSEYSLLRTYFPVLLSCPRLRILLRKGEAVCTSSMFTSAFCPAPTYRVIILVRDYFLLTSFLKFHNLAQLLCNICPICSCPSRIGQTVEQPNHGLQIIVADHHGHPVERLRGGGEK